MRVSSDLETIPCFFHNKETGEMLYGSLVITLTTGNCPVIEIHLENEEKYTFFNYSALFNLFNIGLKTNNKKYNWFQKLIIKIFNL